MSQKERYQVCAEQRVHASKTQVWDFLMEFDDVYKWAPGVTRSHGIGKESLGVGHGRYCHIQGFGGIDEMITHFNEGHSYTYSITPVGPFTNSRSSWSLTPLQEHVTLLTIQLNYELRFGVLGSMMHALFARKKIQTALAESAKAVKQTVETRYQANRELKAALA